MAVRSAYNAAKHALNALTANLRMELPSTHPGIRVSLVMPGVVRTEFAANALGAPATPATAELAGWVPLGVRLPLAWRTRNKRGGHCHDSAVANWAKRNRQSVLEARESFVSH